MPLSLTKSPSPLDRCVPPPAAIFQTVVAVALLLLSGCRGDQDTTTPVPESRTTLVFLDGSTSAGAFPAAKALFADSLRHMIRQRMQRSGDRLSLFVVHEKTLSKSPRLELTNDVRPIEEKPFADERALEAARFRKDQQEELRRLTAEATSFLRSLDGGTFARWTDLWGTLGVASEEIADPSNAAIYYFSDMFESMPGSDRRNFDRRAPAGRSEAETWAEKDAQALSKHMVLRREHLDGVTVRVVMGPLATKTGAQSVKFYWLDLFDHAGLGTVRYN
ncbi:hypothetical protein [Longibacter sp.]|uniref:hypothetical protein n=1 Tax=Longibacter sp. TaxID=2045415 RepID=UPI003EBB629A